MARPKSTAPKKRKITLTVSEDIRGKLSILSEMEGISISQLVARWTEDSIKEINSQLNDKHSKEN